MVRIEHISKKQEPEPVYSQYNLLPIQVGKPGQKSETLYARPYEFVGTMPIRYGATCPHCGQAIWFMSGEILAQDGINYIGCPNCHVGIMQQLPPQQDPFINPIDNKIPSTELDPDLINTLDQGTKTVAEKLKERLGRSTLKKSPAEPSPWPEEPPLETKRVESPTQGTTQKKTKEEAGKDAADMDVEEIIRRLNQE